MQESSQQIQQDPVPESSPVVQDVDKGWEAAADAPIVVDVEPPTDAIASVNVRLEGYASAAFAQPLRAQLLAELVPGRDALVDLAAVERVDACGLQLLLAARAWTARHGGSLTVAVGDGPVRRMMATSGALSLLGAGETSGLAVPQGSATTTVYTG
jgi:anti-anti-sigma regulatory factor